MINSSADPRNARLPSLDGLRAFSIAAVLLGHGAGTHGYPEWLAQILLNPLVDIANVGVRVFFVISGFLITGLLKTEFERKGHISLRRFFFRRTFRIVPAYAVFLLVVWGLGRVGITHVKPGDFWHAVTYTTNYFPQRSWDVGHLWSLAVEEQFYLLWPVVLVIAGLSRARRVLFAVILIMPVWRVLQATFLPAYDNLMGNSFETTADSIALGCLMSLAQRELLENQRMRSAVQSPWLVPGLLLVGVLFSIRYRPALLIGSVIVNLAIAAMILRAVSFPFGRFGRLLNAPIVTSLGLISYSLYLWQQIFMNRQADSWWTSFPVNLLLSFTAAIISYWLIEKPGLRWRAAIEDRFLAPANSVARQ